MSAISQKLLLSYPPVMPDTILPSEVAPLKDGTTTAVTIRRRDDFKPIVKIQLAQRVGYLCSHPQCQRLTVGPRKGEAGANNIGVAAHIKAASPGGPRYDSNQAPAERASEGNGIWLCADHAHLIDHNPREFTVEKLKKWKQEAEERAFQQLASGKGSAIIAQLSDELIQELAPYISRLGLPQGADLASVQAQVRAAALTDIEAYERRRSWPRISVDLELTAEGVEDVRNLDQAHFPQVLAAAQHIVLLSAPGTGKTTTLIQIARKMIRVGPVPVFVPLGAWAESGRDLFDWISRRRGYEALSSAHLKFLADHGELALFLDGWNEVPESARRRLINEMEELETEFPLLNLVMSSRRIALDVPLSGRRISVLPLSDEQQHEIAAGLRGAGGVSVLDAAWRTVGLRDLISIPLYLRALMEATTSGKLPETKEEVLCRMVEAHEAIPANKELFHRELYDAQHIYLTAIAAAAQLSGTPTITDQDARSAVSGAGDKLVSEGQISAAPNPPHVLDILVASHLLVRQDGQLYAFQHQQLQEWFASFDLEAGLVVAGGDLNLEHSLTVVALNDRSWAEVVLFACERMSRKDEASAKVVARVADLLLGIDPMFAAQVMARSGPLVWKLIGDRALAFGRAWHAHDRLDRAMAFMIETKRPEFADIVWPLVSGDNPQDQMRVIRLVPRFNPSVLGDRLARDYAGLPDKARETIAAELALHGDRDAIEVALALALNEPNLDIRLHVFEGLSFRLATRQMEELLRVSGEEFMQGVARKGHFDGIRDPTLLADLIERRKALVTVDAPPETRLARALDSLPDEEAALAVERELKEPSFSFKNHGLHLTHDAWTRFPQQVAVALKWRVENTLDVPYQPRRYLERVEPTDDDPIATLALEDDNSDQTSAACFLAGHRTVRELIVRYLDSRRKFRANGERTEAAYRPSRILADKLESTRASVLIDVLQEFAEGLTSEEIHDLAERLSRHGRGSDTDHLQIPSASRLTAVKLLEGWGWQLVEKSASRHAMAQLTWAMRRVPDAGQVAVLDKMIEADLAGVSAARAAFAANGSNNMALTEMQRSHSHEYRIMLTAIGNDEAEAVLKRNLLDSDFGPEAAAGLQVIWQQRNEPVLDDDSRKFSQWPDFARAIANRSRDHTQSCNTADLLFEAAENLCNGRSPKELGRAARYAGCAVLLPHGNRTDFLIEILKSDLPHRTRLELAQRMTVGGLVLPAGIVLTGLSDAMAEHDVSKWIQDNDLYTLFEWLKLLPMSDDPFALFDGLDAMVAKFEFSKWRVRDLLSSVRHLEENVRVDLLRELLTHYPDLTEQYELFLALKNPDQKALELLLEIAAGKYGNRPIESVTRFDYPDELFLTLSPEARESLPARYDTATDNGQKSFLGRILLAGADHNIFLRLVQDKIGRHIISQFGWNARSKILYVHQPSDIGSSSSTLIPRDLSELRKGLFSLIRSSDPESAKFAADYLIQIDAENDQEGGFDVGPRHPDISSGRPWPLVNEMGAVVVPDTSIGSCCT
ncbi:NACHT domain-containing protein [Phyllobacterium sp. 22229]|uniref:NACHT domain-containing protein n=1 Tax=Phyllobacterium sp. 22229 TaxID=3453895 RepID=UPI003F86C05C